MPRHNHVTRQLAAPGAAAPVVVVIDSVQHTMSESAFIAFMEAALNVLQAIVAQKHKGGA